MEIKWLQPEAPFEKLILAGDIGGTNTNLGLVGVFQGRHTLLMETIFSSPSLDGLLEPIQITLGLAREHRQELAPTACCISAAGPVRNNVCIMTNLSWTIDGNALQEALRMPVRVINDFLAISFGITTLDIDDPAQIHQLSHADGFMARPELAPKAVIGPGTGMGVSYLVPYQNKYIPASSEGGHILFAPFDEDSQSFRNWMARELGQAPGVEPLVSGTGIANLYRWWADTRGLPQTQPWITIAKADPAERPPLISHLSDHDPIAAGMMTLFVKMLARFSSDVAALTLPLGGFYLAGGVAQKQLRWLEKDHLFVRTFVQNYNPNLVPLLRRIPIYLIKDYNISLYGAAAAIL